MTSNRPLLRRWALWGAVILIAFHAAIPAVMRHFGWHAIHDSINWLPFFDYFYSNLAQGDFPYWNPYSHLGTAFFPTLQVLGLLEPSNLGFALIYRLFPDFDPLTVYHYRLMSRLLIFILGTHFTLCEIVRRPGVATLFSAALAFAMLPTFLRQHGVVENHFLLPFATFAILRFFSADGDRDRALWLLVTALFTAASMHLHVPAAFVTHSAIVIAVGFFRRETRRGALAFLRSRHGIVTTAGAVVAGFLACLPIAAALVEIRSGEIFGSARLFITNNGMLPEFYASDLQGDVFFSDLARRVALTTANLGGWVLEPFANLLATIPLALNQPPAWDWYGSYSEIRIYFGVPILGLALVALVRGHALSAVRMFAALFVLMLLVSCSFSGAMTATEQEASWTQRLVLMTMPWFRLIEALQNVAGVAAFDLIVLAAIGWTLASGRDLLWIFTASSVVLAVKILVLPVTPESVLPVTSDALRLALVAGAGLALLAVFLGFLLHSTRAALGALILLDVSLVAGVMSTNVVSSELTNYFHRAGWTSLRRDHVFSLYRPLDVSSRLVLDRQDSHGMSAPELLGREQPALAPPQGRPFGLREQWFDQFFTHRRYYDLVANIGALDRLQLAGVTHPSLDLLPADSVTLVRDRYEATDVLRRNGSGVYPLLVIEQSEPEKARAADARSILSQPPRSPLGVEAREALVTGATWRQLGAGEGEVRVVSFDANSLGATVGSPRGGMLYWAETFSRNWQAWIDGTPAEISRVNLNFMAIAVPPGLHTVTFRYYPRWYGPAIPLYYTGFALFLALIVAVAIVAGRRARDAMTSPAI